MEIDMNIRDYLKKNILLFDGAMGTYVGKRYPMTAGESCEMLNLTHPDWVSAVHKKYLEAGAIAIKTNTFGLHFHLPLPEETIRKMAVQGWNLAKAAVDDYGEKEHFVFADMGSVSGIEEQEKVDSYRKLADIFLDCGAKHFIFETFDCADDLEQITSYIKERDAEAFILVSFGVSPEGFTKGGCYGRSLFYQLQQWESVDAIGFNCISGPKHLLELIQKLDMEHCTKYVSIMPNAGYPTVISNRTMYSNNASYFAETIYEIAREGVAIVGGCCGTEPSFIRAISKLLEKEPLPVASPWKKEPLEVAEYTQQSGAWLAKNNAKNDFAAKLQQGERVIVVELDPPVTPDIEGFMEGAARYKRAGVDAIDIADCPIARARIDSSILACKISRELKMTAIPHMTCRDRNINATKALLLGLNVEGINNVLTVTGDPVPVAERQEVKTVFSYNSAVLARHINTFNETTFHHNPFQVCGALNVNAVNFDSQIAHARRKIENGVNVLFTQPVMSKEGLDNLKRAREELPVKLLGGLIPVVSYRNACFMENEIAGIHVAPEIIAMYEGRNREEGEELAIRIVSRIAEEIVDYVDGFYLITPFQRIALIEKIVKNLKAI